MRLFFRCPEKNELVDSGSYYLEHGHSILDGKNGERELQGKVVLPRCPLCGKKHTYDVKDVMCSLE